MAVALKELFARFGVEFDTKALEKGNETIQGMVKRLTDLGKRLTGPAIVTGLTLFVRGMVQQGQELADQAAAWNMNATSMREWQFVAEASGLPVENMNSALQTLSQNARASVSGNWDLAYSFRRLQVNVRDANGQLKPTGDLMAEVGMQIARIGNPLIRARLTMQHFGEAGRFLIPVFEKGASSIERMRQEVRDMVGGDLDELARQSRQVRAEQARFKLAYDALTTTITLHLLPVFRWVSVAMSKMIAEGKRIIDNTRAIEAAMIVLGAVMTAQGLRMAIAMLPVLLPLLKVAAGIAFLIYLIDDIIVLTQGGKSSIGEFIDAFYGAGTAADFIGGIKLAMSDLTDWLATTALPAIEHFFSGMYDASVETIMEIIDMFLQLHRNIAKIPGISHLLRAVGAVGLDDQSVSDPNNDRAHRGTATRGVGGWDRSNTPIRETVAAVARVAQRGVPGVTSGAMYYGRPSASRDVRIQAPVNITVNPAAGTDPEEVANAVGRIQDERARAAVQHYRRALVPTVQSEDRE